MATINTALSDFTLAKNDVISEQLNVIIQNFAENDAYIYGKFDEIPGVWKCLWYNNDEIKGHKKGAFFWLNTESKQDYLKNNAVEIKAAADANPMITKKLPRWKNNDQEVFDQYNNVLTGYMDERKTFPMQPYAELGNISACVQLITSQKDNNKDNINNKKTWKRFLLEDEDIEQISLSAINAATSAVQDHEYNYHFGKARERGQEIFESQVQTAIKELSSNKYVRADFSNISAAYPENYFTADMHCRGFDDVEYFVRKPYPGRAVSGYTIEYQWFRKWRSGYLEHGGLIKTSNYLLSTGLVTVRFDWAVSDSSAKLYDVRYLDDGHNKLIEIDESRENPPGDNVLSVLFELDPSSFEIKKAPAYYTNDYNLNLTPVYKTAGLSAVADADAYGNLGAYSASRNAVNVSTKETLLAKNGFSLVYDSVNTPEYYMYYATGFCTGGKT